MRYLVATLMCLLVLSSCSAPPGQGPVVTAWKTDTELVTATLGEPDIIDPQLSSFANEAAIVGMLYEPLLSFDPATLALIPAAARALPSVSADGRVYTYSLRPDLTYSDGAPLRAQRFVDAFVRLCDPANWAENAFLAYPIAGCEAWNVQDIKTAAPADLEAGRRGVGVRALDDLTVEFTLAAASTAFAQVTALWIGAPVRIEDLGTPPANAYRPTGLTRVVGNGPFVLTDWIRGDRLVFARNERYRLPVRLAKWTKRIATDPDTIRVMYDAGRVDAYPVTPRDDADREGLLARADIHRVLGPCTSYVGFNTTAPPFDDPNVRLAFAKALDKEAFVRGVTKTGRAAFSLVPHAQPGHAHDDRIQQFDPVEARRVLASSKYGPPVEGLVGGIPLVFAFTETSTTSARTQIEWVVAQWYANLGVRVTPQVQSSWGHPLIKQKSQQPQLYRLGWCEDYPDGQAWYTTLFKSSSNAQRTNFKNERFDDLVTRADVERDPLRREALYEEASRVLSSAAPAAWLSWPEQWWLVDPAVRGYEQSSFDWDFAQFSLARIVGVPPRR